MANEKDLDTVLRRKLGVLFVFFLGTREKLSPLNLSQDNSSKASITKTNNDNNNHNSSNNNAFFCNNNTPKRHTQPMPGAGSGASAAHTRPSTASRRVAKSSGRVRSRPSAASSRRAAGGGHGGAPSAAPGLAARRRGRRSTVAVAEPRSGAGTPHGPPRRNGARAGQPPAGERAA